MHLVTRKGVYPYEYTDSWKKLKECQLPPKILFFSKLNNEEIKDDYNHANKIWNHFKIKTLGEYSDIYLKINLHILFDIFDSLRTLFIRLGLRLRTLFYITGIRM